MVMLGWHTALSSISSRSAVAHTPSCSLPGLMYFTARRRPGCARLVARNTRPKVPWGGRCGGVGGWWVGRSRGEMCRGCWEGGWAGVQGHASGPVMVRQVEPVQTGSASALRQPINSRPAVAHLANHAHYLVVLAEEGGGEALLVGRRLHALRVPRPFVLGHSGVQAAAWLRWQGVMAMVAE